MKSENPSTLGVLSNLWTYEGNIPRSVRGLLSPLSFFLHPLLRVVAQSVLLRMILRFIFDGWAAYPLFLTETENKSLD